MKRLITALEQFLKGAYKNPLWDIATVVFLTLIGFMLTYQLSSTEEQARLEVSINEREAWIADAGRLCTLHLEMRSGMEAVEEPLNQFLAIYKGMIDPGLLPDRERVQENYYSAIKAKERVELLAARFKGVHFRVPVHNEQARRYEALLAHELSVLKIMEDFCVAFLAGDVEKFTRHVRETGSRLSAIRKEEATIDALEQGINLQLEEQVRTNLTENKKEKAQARILTFKKYAHIPAALFCIGYLIAIGRGVNNVLKKSSGVSSRQKRIVARPKKRRRNR